MISISKAYSIRQLWIEGSSVAATPRKKPVVSRDTVCKHLAAEDLSPKPPMPAGRAHLTINPLAA